MADSSLAPPMDGGHDATEVINDLDTMIESVELMSGGAAPRAYFNTSRLFPFCMFTFRR